jgi:hypothetical protein
VTSARNRLSASAALDLLVYSPLDWPGKTVRLDPDSVQSHLQRASSGAASVAEVYHANSGLSSATVGRLLAARTDVAAFRRLTIERSAAVGVRTDPADPSPPSWLSGLLLAARDDAGIDLFYALELRLVHGGVLYGLEPLSGRCAVLALQTAADAQAVDRALRLLGQGHAGQGHVGQGHVGQGQVDPRASPPVGGDRHAAQALVLIVGRLGRHDALYGARGYRRTLVEAGRLSQEMVRLAARYGVSAAVVTEFGDAELDAAALVDGVADSCLVVVELRRVRDDDE